mgnify:CR=1 FL=1
MKLLETICEAWEIVLVAAILVLGLFSVAILGGTTHYSEEDELDYQENQRRLGK